MKNIVSSFATVNANGTQRISITYTSVDETTGKIVEDNKRTNRVVLDEDALAHIDALMEYAQGIVDSE